MGKNAWVRVRHVRTIDPQVVRQSMTLGSDTDPLLEKQILFLRDLV